MGVTPLEESSARSSEWTRGERKAVQAGGVLLSPDQGDGKDGREQTMA